MRNQQLNTEAIILKRINYKDQDKIITLYTKEWGKLPIIAKGVRKLESKRKSHFELGNHIKINLLESRNFYIATQTNIIKTYPKLKTDYEKVNALYYILEIFDGLIPDEEGDNALMFTFIKKTLNTLEEISSKQVTRILNAYTIKLLRMSGFLNDPKEILHSRNNSEFYEYLNQLINKTYEEIINIKSNNYLEGEIFNLSKTYTESILERKIKSRL